MHFPDDIYSLKVNNGNTRTICEICSQLTIKAPVRFQRRMSSKFNALKKDVYCFRYVTLFRFHSFEWPKTSVTN